MKYTIIFCFLFVFACKNKDHNHNHETGEKVEESAKTGPEYTSKYICPMHCKGSGSEAPGVCPVCEMDYVENKKEDSHEGHNHDGHDHENHNHDGHNH